MSTRPSLPDPIRAILDGVRHLVRALRVASRATEKDHGLGTAQLFVLRQLLPVRGTPVSINELAERTLTHQSSVSAVVSKLVEQKLVTRRPSSEDSRRMEVEITEAGCRQLKTAPRSVQEDLVAALRRMPADERETLARLFSKLLREAGCLDGDAPLLFTES
jgi:DNA-binding MarR family transcriptional regulator